MKASLEKRTAKFLIKNKNRLALISTLLFIIFSLGLPELYFDSSYRAYFSEKNPELISFESMEKIYTKEDNIVIVLKSRGKNLFESDSLKVIEKLTQKAWQMPYSIRVDSIANFQLISNDEETIAIADAIEDAGNMTSSDLENLKNRLLEQPELKNKIISPDATTTGIIVTFQIPLARRTEATTEIALWARSLITEFKEAHGSSFFAALSGTVMMDHTFTEIGTRDSTFLVPFSVGLMFLILGILIGTFVGAIPILAITLMSIISAMGAGGFLNYPLTSVTVTAPVIILTVAIANSVHILSTFLDNYSLGSEKALLVSVEQNLQPVFLASITTAIGFLTMNFSEVPPFNHLGNIVSIGVIFSLIFTLAVLPSLLIKLPLNFNQKNNPLDKILRTIINFSKKSVLNHKQTILWSSLIIIVISSVNIPKNELNDIFVHWFDERVEFRRATDFMEENLTGIYSINYSLDSGIAEGVNDISYQRDIERLYHWLHTLPETVHVLSFITAIKSLNKYINSGQEKYYSLPDSKEAAAQYLLLYEMSLPYGLDLNNQINVEKSSSKLTVTTKTLSTRETIELNKKILEWVKKNCPSIKVIEGAGTVLMFSNIGERNIKAMLIGTTSAIFLISLILALSLKSISIGLISLFANLVPAIVGFGIWGIFVGQVGLSLSVVTGMTFGIVIDDTVHFLTKYLRARRLQGTSKNEAINFAFDSVGKALLITSIVLIAGFGLLTTSPFYMNSGMGLMTAIIIMIALLSTFIFLPTMLQKGGNSIE